MNAMFARGVQYDIAMMRQQATVSFAHGKAAHLIHEPVYRPLPKGWKCRGDAVCLIHAIAAWFCL